MFFALLSTAIMLLIAKEHEKQNYNWLVLFTTDLIVLRALHKLVTCLRKKDETEYYELKKILTKLITMHSRIQITLLGLKMKYNVFTKLFAPCSF